MRTIDAQELTRQIQHIAGDLLAMHRAAAADPTADRYEVCWLDEMADLAGDLCDAVEDAECTLPATRWIV